MPIQNLLYKNRCSVTDKIEIVIPTVGQILDNEERYYQLISALTSMPIDMMVQLDDIGIDFTEINEFELFLLLFTGIKDDDTSLVFGDLDLRKFRTVISPDNGHIILYDAENDITIDRAIYNRIADAIRKINNLEKNRKKPGNTEARDFMLQRARVKMKRKKRRVEESQLETLIVALVNTEQFKYDFETIRNLSIYQFNQSLYQIRHKIEYDNRMFGVYTGTINAKDLSQDDLNWIVRRQRM